MSGGQRGQQLHQLLVGGPCFGRKARHDVAEVIRRELRVGVDLASQETLAQWAKRHQANAQLLEYGNDVFLGLAPPQRIFALQCRHRLYRVRAADGLHAGFGQTEVLDLARGDQFFHRAGHVFHRHGGIDPVLVEQVDAIGAQTLQRRIAHGADAFWAAVLALAAVTVLEAEFGGDDDLVAHRLQRLAKQVFVSERTIGLGGVKERDALVVGRTDKLDGLLSVGSGAVAVAKAHASKADGRHREAAAA